MSLWKAFRDGITAATRIPAPLVTVFVAECVTALVLTAPVLAAMDAWVGHRLAARELARGFDWMLLMESLTSRAADGQAASTLLLVMVGAALIAWLLSPLPNILLGGGVLLSYAESRFAWRRFLWGAWHWMFSFFALAILFGVCATLVITLGIGVLIAIAAVRADALTTPALALMALVYAALSMLFEYARVMAVADGTRNIFRTLGRAAVLIARQPIRTFGLYLLMSALGLALVPLYASIIAPAIPFEWGVIGIAAQQVFIVARLWTRLARWAGETALYRQGALAETTVSGDNYMG